jgi:hypothetical protein
MRAVVLSLACALSGCTFHVDGLGGSDRRDFGAFLLDAGSKMPSDLAQLPTPPDLMPAALTDLAPPSDLSGPFIQVTSLPTPAMIDLSKEGTIDWAHWGYGSASDVDRKVNGNNLISNYKLINLLGAAQYTDGRVGYKWNDGQNGQGQRANSKGPSTTGVYMAGISTGASITVPADATRRHARFYLGGFMAIGEVQIQLSDGSVPVWEDHSYGSANDRFNVTYDVEYEGSGPNQVLQVSWTMLTGDPQGNVTLQSATLLAP